MVELTYKNYVLNIPDGVYLPSDDTNLMLDVLKDELKYNTFNNTLEIGPGNAFLALEIYNYSENTTVVDINSMVIDYIKDIKEKYKLNRLNIIYGDLFNKLNSKKYDLIVFNPPYVPSEAIENYATDGGIEGSEIIIKFINNLNIHLTNKGICYLLISSHNQPKKIYKQIIKNNLNYKILREKNIFFENLIILKISK